MLLRNNFQDNGIHLNDAGYVKLARSVLDAMKILND